MLHLLLQALGAATKLFAGDGGNVIVVDSFQDNDSTVAIRFNIDGTVETGKSLAGAPITWSDAGVWIEKGIPNATYEVRFTNFAQVIGANGWNAAAPTIEDIWIDLGAERLWASNLTTAIAVNSFNCDFEVKAATPTPIPGVSSYFFSIENESP